MSITQINQIASLSSRHCDRATRTPTLPYSQITLASTQTSLLAYLGLEQSPANP